MLTGTFAIGYANETPDSTVPLAVLRRTLRASLSAIRPGPSRAYAKGVSLTKCGTPGDSTALPNGQRSASGRKSSAGRSGGYGLKSSHDVLG